MAEPSVTDGLSLRPYGRQNIDDTDIAAVVDVLRSDWLTTGPAVQAFEKAFSNRVKATDAAACSSGTAALHLAALALGLGKGDHVVVPAISFLATANAIRYVGAEVIFADVDPETGLMLPEHLEQALATFKDRHIRAVFPVHLNGQCGDPEGVKALAASKGLRIVDDASHALGTSYDANEKNIYVGSCTHADLTVFSFHPVKTITTGEGGMVTGADTRLIHRVKKFRNHGISRDPDDFQETTQGFENGIPNPWYYEMHEPGFNYRLSDIHGALGLSQLKRLGDFVEKRRELIEHYWSQLAGLAPAVRPVNGMPSCQPGWHLCVVLIDFTALGLSRATLMRRLAEEGIGSQVHYLPINRQPYYLERYGACSLPGADDYYDRCLSLPLFPGMTSDDVDHVTDVFKRCLLEASR